MQTLLLKDLVAETEKSEHRWQEFLRTSSVSMGIYRLKAGEADPQQPHTEDEVYFVVSGKASFHASGRTQAVSPGTLIFVARSVEHRFENVSEDLTLLVFFAPPEGSLKRDERNDHSSVSR